MSDKPNIATYTLAVSLFSLAAAFVYFTIGLTHLANQAPAILDGIEKTSKQIEPVLKEFYKIRELIPPIVTEVKEIRKQIPDILHEVKQVRTLVPPVLEEVKLTREAVPPILVEVKKTREAVPPILVEVKKTREAVPPILVEVKKTREAIPAMLTEVDNLLNNAGNIVKKSSEGAVSGVLTGIIKAPFKLIGGAGKSLFGGHSNKLTEKDRQLSEATALRILSSVNIGKTESWSNPDSGNNGVITLKEIKTISNRQCKVVNFTINIKNSDPVNDDITACLNDENKWEVLKEDE